MSSSLCRCPCAPPYSHSANGCSLSLSSTSTSKHWLFILFLLVGSVHAVAVTSHEGLAESDAPTHSNFLRAAIHGRQRTLWCDKDPTVCLDRDKNPWGGSTCCYQQFCKDTTSDPNHCGACGRKCSHGLVCCGGRCVDIRNDPWNCGSCHKECPGQLGCSYAMCNYGG